MTQQSVFIGAFDTIIESKITQLHHTARNNQIFSQKDI